MWQHCNAGSLNFYFASVQIPLNNILFANSAHYSRIFVALIYIRLRNINFICFLHIIPRALNIHGLTMIYDMRYSRVCKRFSIATN